MSISNNELLPNSKNDEYKDPSFLGMTKKVWLIANYSQWLVLPLPVIPRNEGS